MKLLSLAEAASLSVLEVGGKALGLARLASLGLPVPDTLVLPAHADGSSSEGEAAELWAQASSLGAPLAVRSSAADEDIAERSGAGQYESVMGVGDANALAAAIERIAARKTQPLIHRVAKIFAVPGRLRERVEIAIAARISPQKVRR